MKAFATLFFKLDETIKTKEKVNVLADYFSQVEPIDAAWGLHFLSGRKLPQVVASKRLKAWTMELAAIPEWLFAECYEAVGDLAETMGLLLPSSTTGLAIPLHQLVEDRLIPLKAMAEIPQKEALIALWLSMDTQQQLVWNKLITGQFRVGVSQALITQAIAQIYNLDKALVAHRLMGDWRPSSEFWLQLVSPSGPQLIPSQPYPFCLANALLSDLPELGDISNWQVEWKWDGIRAQLIKRDDQVFIWSRGEELITTQFPELADAARNLPNGMVIDGEILPWQNERIALFGLLQRRIGRKILTKRMLEEIPVVFYTYDLLELHGQDYRTQPLYVRRQALEKLLRPLATDTILRLSSIVTPEHWEALGVYRQQSREHLAEGLMLKEIHSPYATGRRRGLWWKWKVDPYIVDAVLIAAQAGHGRRAGLYTDYTFAVWLNNELVPFAKAYSGLTDKEIHQVDAFVKRNTLQKFGPVRSVKAELVFEIAFEGIQVSKRHKSGVAVRFPRILRWRLDKTAAQADSLENLIAFLN